MLLRIFTLPFDNKTESFDDELIQQFCLNKKVLQLQNHFFQQEGGIYWTVAVQYEVVALQKADQVRELDEAGQLLYQRLREWRKQKGAKEGIPAYLIATNAQLVKMIQLRCTTLESFKAVKGYGKKRISKYGRRINELIKGFEEEQAAKPESAAATADRGDTPPYV